MSGTYFNLISRIKITMKRKISIIGGYSFSAILPINWVRKMNAKFVNISEEEDGSLKITAEAE